MTLEVDEPKVSRHSPTQRFAREWLWLVACVVLSVLFYGARELRADGDVIEGVGLGIPIGIFAYVVFALVRLTTWAIRKVIADAAQR